MSVSTANKSRFPGGSLAVAAGIILSRIAGLARQSVFAYFFGNSPAADAFNAAFRIPNLLQNLFGEGALSGSFIPVYANLRAQGREEEAKRVAWAVFSALALVVSLLALAGVLFTPLLIDLIAPGFTGEKREVTITLAQFFFPGAGFLVLSAWCLGVLNSHRLFFLSYAAPVVWSASIVAALLLGGQSLGGFRLAEWGALGATVGSLLQFLFQLPTVFRLAGGPRAGLGLSSPPVREVLRNFVPVALSRGVVQISAYVDQIIASFLPSGSVAALAYGAVLYTLPVSLFGIAVSAAELPEMSSALGNEAEVGEKLRGRIVPALKRMAFFVVPSAAAFLFIGDALAAVLFQRGKFSHEDAVFVWSILAGSGVGLLAATFGRLYSSAFYALRDPKTPFRFAAARVALVCVLGYLFALPLPRLLGLPPTVGAAGLTLSAGLAGWVEYALLRAKLTKRVGPVGLPRGSLYPLWLAAVLAGLSGRGALYLTGSLDSSPFVTGVGAIALFGIVYFAATHLAGVAEAGETLRRAAGIIRRR